MTFLQLMHQNEPIARIAIENQIPVGYMDVYKKELLPLGTYHENSMLCKALLKKWYEGRSIPGTRVNLAKLLQKTGENIQSMFWENMGVSITDTYWFKKETDTILWDDINYYQNGFDPVFQNKILKEIFQKGKTPDYTTDGIMEKFWFESYGEFYLAKLDRLCHNLLCANEVVYSQIAKLLEISVCSYTHQTFHDLNMCICPCFIKNEKSDFLSAMQIKHAYQYTGLNLLRYFKNLGFEKEIKDMMTLDCILHNTDRHEKNFGFIKEDNVLSFVPLYDNGYCLGANYIQEFQKNNTLSLNHKIANADMKLLSDSREQILQLFPTEYEISFLDCLSILQDVYEMFHVPETIFALAKQELEAGIEIYHNTQKKIHFISWEKEDM